jgi:hypothetical protein
MRQQAAEAGLHAMHAMPVSTVWSLVVSAPWMTRPSTMCRLPLGGHKTLKTMPSNVLALITTIAAAATSARRNSFDLIPFI